MGGARSVAVRGEEHALERLELLECLTRSQGDRFERVTFDDAFDGLPVFSPDGRRLMWTSKRGGLDEAQVFIADFKLPSELR